MRFGVTKLSSNFTFKAFVARIKRRLPSNLITSLSELAVIEQPCTALGWEEKSTLDGQEKAVVGDSSSSDVCSKASDASAYVCDACGTSYKTGTASHRTAFFKHTEVFCKEKKVRLNQNRCDHCAASFSHLPHLKDHIRDLGHAGKSFRRKASKAKKHQREMPATVKAKRDGLSKEKSGGKAKPKRRSRKIGPA